MAVIVVVHLVGRAAAVVAAADTDPGSELHWVGNTVTDRAMSYSTGGEKRGKTRELGILTCNFLSIVQPITGEHWTPHSIHLLLNGTLSFIREIIISQLSIRTHTEWIDTRLRIIALP